MALRSLANSLSADGKAGVAKLIQRIHDLEPLLVEDFVNRFASYFLIPRDGLQERLDILGIKTVKQPEEVVQIARYFGVSYDATLHSLNLERKWVSRVNL